MSSRLRLQKGKTAREKAKAEQQALQEETNKEQALFASLQGAPPGTAVVIAGHPPDELMQDADSEAAPAAQTGRCRASRNAPNVLISDSESAAASESENGSAEEDFSAESDSAPSQGSESCESEEDSPPPAKRGKKAAPKAPRSSRAAQNTQKKPSKAAAQAAVKGSAASKPVSITTNAANTRPGSQQKSACTNVSAPSVADELEETLPVKMRAAKGDLAPSRDRPAASTAAVLSTAPQQTTAQQKAAASTRAVDPTAGSANEGVPKKCTASLQASNALPRHMAKGIQINSPGPAYRAPGLRRPVGGKPLHPIQPRPS